MLKVSISVKQKQNKKNLKKKTEYNSLNILREIERPPFTKNKMNSTPTLTLMIFIIFFSYFKYIIITINI